MARRESELAEGHAEFRFSGYVTISAPDRAELEVPAPRPSTPLRRPISSCAGSTAAKPRPSPGPSRSLGAWPEMKPPPSHRATTAHLQALYPFVSDGGLGGWGPLIGRDLLGDPFRFDPWDLYRDGVLTNPNVLVVGQIGRGKSSLIKTVVWRQLAFGRRAWIVDPKGEYGPLTEACGSTPIRLEPGGGVRLNPLDVVMGRSGADGGEARAQTHRPGLLAGGLVAGTAARPERAHCGRTGRTSRSRQAGRPTLRDVVAGLLDPDAGLAATVRTDAASLAEEGRVAASNCAVWSTGI